MLKIIFGALVLIASTFVGASYSRSYKKKEKFYELFFSLNSDLKINLSFHLDNVKEIIDSKNKYEIFSAFYNSALDGRRCETPSFLTTEQSDFVNEFFSAVGKRDAETESEFLEYSEQIIKKELLKSSEESKKYRNFGEKIGFGFGLIFFVLIL